MVLTRRQAQIIINHFNSLPTNQQIHIAATVECVLIPSKGNTNNEDPQGLKIYLQEKKDIDKEAEKLDISV